MVLCEGIRMYESRGRRVELLSLVDNDKVHRPQEMMALIKSVHTGRLVKSNRGDPFGPGYNGYC